MIPATEPLTAKIPATSTSLSIENSRLFAVAVVLSVVPLWFGNYLPSVDLPGHSGVITALQQLSAGNVMFTEAFEADWFTPYLLGYLLIYAIAWVLPVTTAIKLVVSVSIAAMSLLTAVLLRSAGADSRWRWLAIPNSYSYAFYWGFLSYLAALPFALLLLVGTFRFAQRTTMTNALIVASLTLLLFFSHVIVMGFACLCALVYLLGREYKNPRRLLLLCLPYTAPLPLIAAWLIPRLANEAGVADAPVVFGDYLQRLGLLVAQPAGFEYPSWIAFVVTAVIVALPPMAGAKFTRDPARWLPFAVVLVSFLTIPAFAVDTGFLYERLGVFLVPFWLLAWDSPSSAKRRLEWIAMPIVLIWLFGNTVRFAAFARETQYFDDVVASMEPGRRVAAMIVHNGTPLFRTPVYLHFASWYQTLEAGIVDFNFADFQLVLRRKDVVEPRVDEYLAWYPWLFDWRTHGGDHYDYFLVKADGDAAELIFKEQMSSVKLISQSGWWWVYENVDRRDSPSSP